MPRGVTNLQQYIERIEYAPRSVAKSAVAEQTKHIWYIYCGMRCGEWETGKRRGLLEKGGF